MAEMTFQVRPATLADVEAIAGIEVRAFERASERFDVEKITALLSNRRTIALACEDGNGRVIGWAAGFTRVHRQPRWGRIYALAVDPEIQGKGVGQRLVSELAKLMRESGANDLFLEVRTDNAGAMNLYRKLGFTHCRLLPDFYAPGVHGQRMILKG